MFFEAKNKSNATWKATDQGYYFYVDGQDVGKDTVNSRCGPHAVVYYKSNDTTYILDEYVKRKDNKERPAEILTIGDTVYWMREDNGFRLIRKGQDIAPQTANMTVHQEFLVYLIPENTTFLLDEFKKVKNGAFQPARILSTSAPAHWYASRDNFFIIHKERSMSVDVRFTHIDQDLLVYDPSITTTFVLHNYVNLRDNTLHPAAVLSESVVACWRAWDSRYVLYCQGKPLTKGLSHQVLGNDLAVLSDELQTMFNLSDFRNKQDNTLRPVG
ncbi:MAG: hypothetical protein GF313_17005 [Caldithrix sp.]|nr:hypothetical protein [Caldithrix sp.]